LTHGLLSPTNLSRCLLGLSPTIKILEVIIV
jgi:hypothetical protein